MGAINGVFDRHGATLPDAAIVACEPALADYAQDGSKRWVDGSVALGHHRSEPEQDDEAGALPWYDAFAGLAITADVRLDNRDDLAAALSASTEDPAPDACLIVRAWQKWGRDCPRHLVGDYAFAIWDARQRTLFCARDHIGARPFYYNLTPRRFVFASDIRAVLAAPEVSDQLDDDYVAATLLAADSLPVDRTYFTAVRKLPPGHSLTVGPETERRARYWFPAESSAVRFAAHGDYVDAARALYTRAVRDRLRTAHPIGVHLSGGLDSSSVAALAAREQRRNHRPPPGVFCWQPPPDTESAASWEHASIDAVCAQEELRVQYCPMTLDQAFASLRKDPSREPVTSTLIVEDSVQRLASAQGIGVMLSGWGGDESLSTHGHGFAAELLLRGRWNELYRHGRSRDVQPWKLFARETMNLLWPEGTPFIRAASSRSRDDELRIASVVHPDVRRRANRLRAGSFRHTSVRATLVHAWSSAGLTERIESWHASGARYGLTYAYPLLDRRLLEFVAGVPPEQHVREGWTRWLMRRTIDGVLPAALCWQRDKSDPVRSDQSLSVVREALSLIGRQLRDAPLLPSRSRYLDMPRLLQQLDPEALAQTRKVGHLLRAVQFLDF